MIHLLYIRLLVTALCRRLSARYLHIILCFMVKHADDW